MRRAVLSLALLAAVASCKRTDGSGAEPASSTGEATHETSPAAVPTTSGSPALRGRVPVPDGPIVGVIVGQANIMSEPSTTSKRLGYLHLGGIVARDPEPVGKAGCPGGWYRIKPRGFVCVGDEATIDPNHPVLRAAAMVRPDRVSVLPYRYGFVRAVLPLYLRAPSREDQLKSEFKLKEHLEKFAAEGETKLNSVTLGSYDVPLDGRGAPIVGGKLGDVPRPSTTWSQGELFGGAGDDDPIPFWLQGGRKIPNLADFKVPEYAAFADRARRHTGLAFVGSFKMGEDGFNRRFGITTDLRLAPTSKVKPDTGSPWHGIELGEGTKSPPMPFAWVRVSEAHAYKLTDGKAKEKGSLEKRSIVLLTGKKVSGPDDFYWELKNGLYIKASHASVVMQPTEWPDAAKQGKKWIDVSIDNQTLVLWEGQKAVYATMVSTGQDKMGDPKTTKSTIRGVFQIRSKHVTATMDSNEGSSQGGGRRASVASTDDRESRSGDDDRPKKKKDKGEKGDKKAKEEKGSGGEKKNGRDPEYGVTKRRGEGTFWLRDVPYVEYFESGYALHVAYWHDVFGIARSHGCINLSPIDGKYIFGWTDPPVPDGWHGVVTGAEMGEGTTVFVHE